MRDQKEELRKQQSQMRLALMIISMAFQIWVSFGISVSSASQGSPKKDPVIVYSEEKIIH